LAELKKEETGGSLYKGLGLDKVLGRFSSGVGKEAEEGQHSGVGVGVSGEKKDVPGAAPADAAKTESAQKPTADSGTGNPETIH
jgi:hypothetical protein